MIVRLPGGRKLVIDAKCSLNAYLDACDEVDDESAQACFRAHVASMRNHAQQLGSKAYWAQFGDAADYVIMYIPGEHFLAAALEQDPTLWDWAFERRVLLATPTNLVAIAKTVASIWRQERLAEAAQEIANLGKELHSRLATMNEHMTRVGKNLATANGAYNQMVGSFESQVLTQAKRFETLGAGSAKTLDTPPMVEVAPRPLTKIAAPAGRRMTLPNRRRIGRFELEPAAALEALPVHVDLDLVGVGAVAHPVAAPGVDDVHVDPRRLVDFAGEPDDHLGRRLEDWLSVGLGEGEVVLVDQQVPERLGAERVIGRGRRRRRGHAGARAARRASTKPSQNRSCRAKQTEVSRSIPSPPAGLDRERHHGGRHCRVEAVGPPGHRDFDQQVAFLFIGGRKPLLLIADQQEARRQ